MRQFLPIAIICLFLPCAQTCSSDRGAVYADLVRIDQILNEQPTAARDSLTAMNPAQMDDREKAYYNLLLTIADHKNHIDFTSDSSISSARQFYLNHTHDYRQQARSCFYHGIVLSYISPLDTSSFHYMKEAATLVEKHGVQDDRLIALLSAYIGKIHSSNGNVLESLDYFQAAVDAEGRLGNNRNQIIDYCYLLTNMIKADDERSHLVMQQLDSVLTLHPACHPTSVDNTKALYHLYVSHQYDSALFYCQLWNPTPGDIGTKQQLLASIYKRAGPVDSAIRWERIAYSNRRSKDSSIYYYYFYSLADLYDQQGNADSAAHYALMAYRSLRDVMDERTEKRVLELEKQYDVSSREAALAKTRQQRNLLIVAVCALVLLLASFLRQRFMQKKQRAAETMANSVIYAAARTHQNTLSQLKELQRKPKFRTVESLQDNISVITKDLRRGFTQHFSEALANNLASLPPHIRQSVEKLSGERAKIVYILTELGYSESEIAEFTCTSIDSVRTIGNNNEKVLS